MPSSPYRRFLIVGDHVSGLKDAIAAARADLELRLVRLKDVTEDDLAWADGFVGFRRPSTRTWGRVRWIHSIGAGVDGLVLGSEFPATIVLTKTTEDFGPAIGEWCVARALAENQHLAALAEDQRARRWRGHGGADPIMLRDQRVLILGTGLVGQGIARAFGGLGARVDGLSRGGSSQPGFRRVDPTDRFEAVVGGTDWLILAAPLTPATHGWLGRDRMARCGGAYLMNVGRGALADESAIPDAIDRGWLRGAALDVFATEPLDPASPLWGHPKISISPHVSGPSTIAGTAEGFLRCLEALEAGQAPATVVDPKRGY
ncbi:MAG: D-2-hydroxyacid dehydrogenase [Gemmatimonadetes bacterium]|nr:D-2-hydroxyacid dehydrogenase [Gemmatimonadota bacterium]